MHGPTPVYYATLVITVRLTALALYRKPASIQVNASPPTIMNMLPLQPIQRLNGRHTTMHSPPHSL